MSQLKCTYILKHTPIVTKDEVQLSISLGRLLHLKEKNIYHKLNIRDELGASLLFDRLFLRQLNREDIQTLMQYNKLCKIIATHFNLVYQTISEKKV